MESFSAAKTYEDSSSAQKEEGHKLIELLAPEKGSKVLDVGCGTGYLTKVLADLVGPHGKVVGIDTNAERLKLAREKYPASNIDYIEGSAEDIPAVSDIDSYDYVFSSCVLHWCENKDKVFKEVYRLLTQGGKFGFATGTYYDPFKLLFTPEIVSSEFSATFKERLRVITMDKYANFLTSNNFEILSSKEGYINCKYCDVHNFIDMLRAHTHGDFDLSHFNIDAARRHFGEGEFDISYPLGIFLAQKV